MDFLDSRSAQKARKNRMENKAFEKRTLEILAEEVQQAQRWQWLSFADDEGFLGVVIVRARGLLDAVTEVNRRNLNPHGEVACTEIPDDLEAGHLRLIEDHSYRLLDQEEATKLDESLTALG
jgi:hypothetical protein